MFFQMIILAFPKGISVQQCLITLTETWKKYLGNNESFEALLTDLSKTFDCVNHKLLIAKLHDDGLDSPKQQAATSSYQQ